VVSEGIYRPVRVEVISSYDEKLLMDGVIKEDGDAWL
jgi:hypothetical protein